MEQEYFDASKEFQNYVLVKGERPYHGVVIPRELCETEELPETLMIWTVPPFGWTCSTYFILRMLARALELCIGDHTNTNNSFHWHHVQFNLPCTIVYDPSLPRVWLICFDRELVVRFIVFFDDERLYELGAEFVRSGLRQIFSVLQFLRNREAARKRTAGGKGPQGWYGCCVYTDHNLLQKFLSHTKWYHLRMTLTWFAKYSKRKLKAPHKRVLENCGFLVYFTLTYSFLTAYMKGIHLS